MRKRAKISFSALLFMCVTCLIAILTWSYVNRQTFIALPTESALHNFQAQDMFDNLWNVGRESGLALFFDASARVSSRMKIESIHIIDAYDMMACVYADKHDNEVSLFIHPRENYLKVAKLCLLPSNCHFTDNDDLSHESRQAEIDYSVGCLDEIRRLQALNYRTRAVPILMSTYISQFTSGG